MALQAFKAESKRLLDLMINSIYTHKEIFLRELISNASDAIDKLYYRELDTGTAGKSKDEFYIKIIPDSENRTLTISDNGCGMTKEDLKQNLGTIADSGTLRFREENKDKLTQLETIGKFGVGFYAAFMVAKKVTVISRAFGADEANMWQSEGVEGFSIKTAKREVPGTDIILELKDDIEDENYSEFLNAYRLKSLIKKYSDYIRYPIKMNMEERTPIEKDGKTEYETTIEEKTLNSMVPLYKRDKKDITDENYNSFYQEKFFDYAEPLHRIHFNIEGTSLSFTALLFFPSRPPFDYYTKEYEKGLQLYSNGVMIMEKCPDLLGDYFSFVKGVIDSGDLSLNISREMLQHDRQLKVIASSIEKKIKNELTTMLLNDREKYEKLYGAFGLQLKYGVYSGYGQNKELLQDLLLFHSMDKNSLITFKEYIDAMPEAQKAIYYASGENINRISSLPQLDRLKDKGYDVLFLTEDVDEFALQIINSYQDKPFQSIGSGNLDLGDEEENKKTEEQAETNKDMLKAMEEALEGKVKAVRLSKRLKTHAVCLSVDGALSIEMEKVLNAMPADNKVKAERVLELNGDHEAFEKLKGAYENDNEQFLDYTQILYTQAQIMEGILPDDISAYTQRVLKLL